VITNHPAKYRDPKTGLPYHNSYAYKEIQRLHRGDYKWSQLIGAWVGSGTFAAKGVPERFLNPDWKPEEEVPPPAVDEKGKGSAQDEQSKGLAVDEQSAGKENVVMGTAPIPEKAP
jgi:vacuolar protein sorting-associated protein 72